MEREDDVHSRGLQGPIYAAFMMTSSNGNIFCVTGPLCGEFTGPGEFPAQRPVTRSFDVFFDLRLNKRLSKQSWGWWFETPSWSLWRHRNVAMEAARTSTVVVLTWIIRYWPASNTRGVNISGGEARTFLSEPGQWYCCRRHGSLISYGTTVFMKSMG